MLVLSRLGLFETKALPLGALVQLAAAYVGYIVLCNLSLKVNTVGFYQVRRATVCERVGAAVCEQAGERGWLAGM